MKDIGLLAVTELIIHQPPRQDGSSAVQSDLITPLTPNVRLFFEQRIKSVGSGKSGRSDSGKSGRSRKEREA